MVFLNYIVVLVLRHELLLVHGARSWSDASDYVEDADCEEMRPIKSWRKK